MNVRDEGRVVLRAEERLVQSPGVNSDHHCNQPLMGQAGGRCQQGRLLQGLLGEGPLASVLRTTGDLQGLNEMRGNFDILR